MQPEVNLLVEPAASLEEAFLRALTNVIGQRSFEHWFPQKTAVTIVGDECTILVGNPFLLKWLQKQFRAATQTAAESVIGPAARVRFDVPVQGEIPANSNTGPNITTGAKPLSSGSMAAETSSLFPSVTTLEVPVSLSAVAGPGSSSSNFPALVAESAEAPLVLRTDVAPYSGRSEKVATRLISATSATSLSAPSTCAPSTCAPAAFTSTSQLPTIPSVARLTAVRDPHRLSFDTSTFTASSSAKPASAKSAPAKATAVKATPVRSTPVRSTEVKSTEVKSTPASIPNYIQPAQQLAPRSAARATSADSLTTAHPAAGQSPRLGRKFADLQDFVTGPANELALTAASQVCQFPGQQLNPLVICGNSGLGKTHLLEGIHRQLRQRQPGWQVMYITAEAFANYFTQALREHTLPSFRQKFRNVDVLLMDDAEFFEGKRAIQEEFLHTFKHLASHGKQIVIAADRHPRLLTKLTDDLRTRLVSGMVCRVEMPDLSTREKIVTQRARQIHADVAPEALRYIAGCFTGSVRELEGAVNALATLQTMTNKRVTLTTARKVLSDLERDCVRIVKMGDVERAVCQVFGVEPQDLRSTSKARSVTQPRMLAMYLARKHTHAAYSEIGDYFGGRDHSTVMAAERKVTDWLSVQSTLKVATQSWPVSELIDNLEHQLRTA